jgi:hypothetical protein
MSYNGGKCKKYLKKYANLSRTVFDDEQKKNWITTKQEDVRWAILWNQGITRFSLRSYKTYFKETELSSFANDKSDQLLNIKHRLYSLDSSCESIEKSLVKMRTPMRAKAQPDRYNVFSTHNGRDGPWKPSQCKQLSELAKSCNRRNEISREIPQIYSCVRVKTLRIQ